MVCKRFLFGLVWVGILSGNGLAWGEWGRQTLDLSPGWNAIFLEVQPVANDCGAVFSGIPVESVWLWNKRFEPVQFVQEPGNLSPKHPDWLTWFPPEHESAFLTDLYVVNAGQCYLVQLAGSTGHTVLIEGRREVRNINWVPDSFNFVGFHVDGGAPPTFKRFFSADKALSSQPVYRTLANGANQLVQNPETETLRQGEAYWVYCQGASHFSGPLRVDFPIREGLVFGDKLREQTLKLTNESDEPRNVTVRLLPSQRPEKSSEPLVNYAGDVALSYYSLISWVKLESPLSFTMPPGRIQEIQLAVRRADMRQTQNPEALYESVLEVSDDKGMLYRIPVSSKGAITWTGLWVGDVSLNAVSEAGNSFDPLTPKPVAQPFQFRIILHVDENNVARLLQHVSLMQVQATLGPSPEDPGVQIETSPARYVALSNDALIPEYEGISLKDGRLVGRRISAPAFSFGEPVTLTGQIAEELSGTLLVDYRDPLNPFMHRYHPDHNNLDEHYSQELPEGLESYTFSRAITLAFTEQDPESLGLPEWGYELIGGNYTEVLSGVHVRDIYMSGTFRMTKVLDVPVLNDGR